MADPLEEPRPDVDAARAAAILAGEYGLSGTIEPLSGERDANFALQVASGERFVLKVLNPADPPEVVEMRLGALAHIRRVDPGLPVCRTVPTRKGELWTTVVADDGRVSAVQLDTFLEGHHPVPGELGAAALEAWGAAVARLGRALRGYFHPAAAYPIQWDLRHAGDLRAKLAVLEPVAHGQVAAALDRFDARVAPVFATLRAQVIHNDMSRDNVLVDASGAIVGIIDFGDLTHSALVCDLAVAVADVLAGRDDALELAPAIVAGYSARTPLERVEADLLGDLVVTRLVTALVVGTWRRAHQREAPPVPAGVTAFLRLIDDVGVEAFSATLARAASPRAPGGVAALPYRPRSDGELLAARRRVLGPLALQYREPVHLVRGVGAYLFDAAGRRYIDAYNNVPVVGHCHPRVVAALSEQAHRLVTNTRYLHEASVSLAERLCAVAPGPLDRVLLLNSGSEANDVAWRIACHATGGSGILATRFAYHGVTAATTDISPEEWPQGARTPDHVGLVAAPVPGAGASGARAEMAAATAALVAAGHRPAAFFLDPAFMSDGILGPASEWVAAAVDGARRAGALFVADEVQAGFGRTGSSLWSIGASAVMPDFVTLGKPMGNGFPVAAVLGRSEIVDPFIAETGYFSTFGGNTLACSAALAVLDVLEEEDLVAHAGRVGAELHAAVASLVADDPGVAAVRAFGLVCGVELGGPSPRAARRRTVAVANRLRELGVLVGMTGPGGNVLKIRPPLVFSSADADEVARALRRALADCPPTPH